MDKHTNAKGWLIQQLAVSTAFCADVITAQSWILTFHLTCPVHIQLKRSAQFLWAAPAWLDNVAHWAMVAACIGRLDAGETQAPIMSYALPYRYAVWEHVPKPCDQDTCQRIVKERIKNKDNWLVRKIYSMLIVDNWSENTHTLRLPILLRFKQSKDLDHI